jgi:hypothetical protein
MHWWHGLWLLTLARRNDTLLQYLRALVQGAKLDTEYHLPDSTSCICRIQDNDDRFPVLPKNTKLLSSNCRTGTKGFQGCISLGSFVRFKGLISVCLESPTVGSPRNRPCSSEFKETNLMYISLSTHGSLSRAENVLKHYARQEDLLEIMDISGEVAQFLGDMALFHSGPNLAVFPSRRPSGVHSAEPHRRSEPNFTDHDSVPPPSPSTIFCCIKERKTLQYCFKQAPKFLRALIQPRASCSEA